MVVNREHLRLGIITGKQIYRDEKGQLWANHGAARLFNALLKIYPKCSVCFPIIKSREPKKLSEKLDFSADVVQDLPPLATTVKSQRYYFQTRRIIRAFAKRCEALFVQLPFQCPAALLELNKPKLLYVVGNPREIIRNSPDYRGIMRFAAQAFAAHGDRTMKRLVAEPMIRAVTNGEELWRVLGCSHGKIAVSSCLSETEMSPRPGRSLHDPPRILFLGYIRPEKGCLVLLDAFDRLHSSRRVSLTLAGDCDRATRVESLVRERIAQSPYAADIHRTGMLEFGPELFALYQNHDVYVLPSFSEGTPRTLIESRAFGCPVVATRVGGIPTSVTDGIDGLLVPPGDPDALASAIGKILDDESLRYRLIENGARKAMECSQERFVASLASEIDSLF